MTITLDHLRPYVSLVLARTQAGSLPDVAAIATDLGGILGGQDRHPVGTRTVRGLVTVQAFRYTVRRPPPWLDGHQLEDAVHHLAAVLAKNELVAICLSDHRMRDAVHRGFGHAAHPGLQALKSIPQGVLNAAFVKGHARTLWLSGAHRRTAIKADSKVLSGTDLASALNPLDDQTFFFTSARCESSLATPVGVTPRRSRVWMGLSRDAAAFFDMSERLLDAVAAAGTPADDPLPILATPCSDATTVETPFDAALVAPEPEGGAVDPNDAADAELWTLHTNLEVRSVNGAGFRARVTQRGKSLGELEVSLDLTDPERPVCSARSASPAPGGAQQLTEAARRCERPDWLRVWYDSGHTLADGQLYRVRHRDLPFDGLHWVDFTGYQVTVEKPDPVDQVGAQSSLFCWTKKTWPCLTGQRTGSAGWLACDDGAGEKADFIHLDEGGPVPTLSLIHVKGAKSDSAGRRVSVAAFEVVTSQAVKNLRYLEPELLGTGLKNGLARRISSLVWHNDRVVPAKSMIRQVAGLGTKLKKQVVIVQPHATMKSMQVAKKGMSTGQAMLHALLLSADAACRGRGASLLVVGCK